MFPKKLLLIFGLHITLMSPAQRSPLDPPTVPREFRAAWIATVANIDWPSKPGLKKEEWQAEAIRILDFLQSHNMNAAILQVRPQADALYQSGIEPWSYFFTGKQGREATDNPAADPLEFWITEAHKRCIELHVWLNPYRAHHKDGKEVSQYSIVKKHPEWVVYLKEGYWWLDPAIPEVQDLTNAVVEDLVKRYDIDGVHMDDYFYPYPSYNNNEDFPDTASWRKYQQAGGQLSRGDWRRDAVNKLVKRLHSTVRSAKWWVKFGVSPFGIWRPGYPESIQGFDQYDQLYADAKRWFNEGWVDYMAPQLYWPVNRYAQSFPVLLGWWSRENSWNKGLWPGIAISKDTSDKSIDETINEIMITRGMQPQSPGVIHWNISALMANRRLADTLLKSVYKEPALPPPSEYSTSSKRVYSTSTTMGSNRQISWTNFERNITKWVVYTKYGTTWSYQILPVDRMSMLVPEKKMINGKQQELGLVFVTSINRMGVESEKIF